MSHEEKVLWDYLHVRREREAYERAQVEVPGSVIHRQAECERAMEALACGSARFQVGEYQIAIGVPFESKQVPEIKVWVEGMPLTPKVRREKTEEEREAIREIQEKVEAGCQTIILHNHAEGEPCVVSLEDIEAMTGVHIEGVVAQGGEATKNGRIYEGRSAGIQGHKLSQADIDTLKAMIERGQPIVPGDVLTLIQDWERLVSYNPFPVMCVEAACPFSQDDFKNG